VALNEIIAEFRLEDVKSSPAFFDEQKLQAFNAEYIRALSAEEFIERTVAWWRDRWAPLAPVVQERVRTLADVPRMVDFLLLDEPVFDEKDWEKGVRKQPAFGAILDGAATAYQSIGWDATSIEDAALSSMTARATSTGTSNGGTLRRIAFRYCRNCRS